MYDKEFIITISDFDKNKTTKRKGDAFELFVGWTLRTLNESIPIPLERQLTIKKAIEAYSKIFFPVERKFYLSFEDKTIKEYNVVSENNSDIILNKRHLLNKGKISVNYKNKRKHIQENFIDVTSLIDFLIENEFISKIEYPAISKKFRLDFCGLAYDKLRLLESKDKGKTFLEKRDIDQIVAYAKIIQAILPEESFGYIQLVVNGYLNNLEREIERINQHYGIEIRLHHIKNWLIRYARKKGIKVDCLIFSKHKLGKYGFKVIRSGKVSELYLNIHTSSYNEAEEYKPIEQLISDDFNVIKEFLKGKIKFQDASLEPQTVEKQLVIKNA